MNRYMLFARRLYTAHQLGFRFYGTTYTSPPKKICFAGQTIKNLFYPNDPTLVEDVINLWLDDEYGLRKINQPINTIVDVGANVGLFSLWARYNFTNATIHAYEPNPTIYKYAAVNVSDMDISLFNEGVASENCSARIISASSSREVMTEKDPHGQIELRSISDVIDRVGGYVDLLKIDCEGAEWDIFEQTSSFRNVRLIRMEYHLVQSRDISVLGDTASRLGFRIVGMKPNRNFGIAWLENNN